jgi:hypothetical protein
MNLESWVIGGLVAATAVLLVWIMVRADKPAQSASQIDAPDNRPPALAQPAPVLKPANPDVEEYVSAFGKSYWVGFFLALFFGPIGLLYSSLLGGIALILAAIFLVPSWGGGGAVILWILAVIFSFPGVDAANRRARATATLLAKK